MVMCRCYRRGCGCVGCRRVPLSWRKESCRPRKGSLSRNFSLSMCVYLSPSPLSLTQTGGAQVLFLSLALSRSLLLAGKKDGGAKVLYLSLALALALSLSRSRARARSLSLLLACRKDSCSFLDVHICAMQKLNLFHNERKGGSCI